VAAVASDPLTAILAQGAKHKDGMIRRWAKSLLQGDGRATGKGPRRRRPKPAAK
jgi:hypothetical protein